MLAKQDIESNEKTKFLLFSFHSNKTVAIWFWKYTVDIKQVCVAAFQHKMSAAFEWRNGSALFGSISFRLQSGAEVESKNGQIKVLIWT